MLSRECTLVADRPAHSRSVLNNPDHIGIVAAVAVPTPDLMAETVAMLDASKPEGMVMTTIPCGKGGTTTAPPLPDEATIDPADALAEFERNFATLISRPWPEGMTMTVAPLTEGAIAMIGPDLPEPPLLPAAKSVETSDTLLVGIAAEGIRIKGMPCSERGAYTAATPSRAALPAPAPLPRLSDALARRAAIFGPFDIDEPSTAPLGPWQSLGRAAGRVVDLLLGPRTASGSVGREFLSQASTLVDQPQR